MFVALFCLIFTAVEKCDPRNDLQGQLRLPTPNVKCGENVLFMEGVVTRRVGAGRIGGGERRHGVGIGGLLLTRSECHLSADNCHRGGATAMIK
jgi:hypothetical protein